MLARISTTFDTSEGVIMANNKVVVIGGGIAGLASGIYAQANGWDTTVFEMHTAPGGLCTSR